MAVLVAALVGCAYKPGTFAYPQKPFPGHRVAVGCLDVAIDRRADMNGSDAVVEYTFGNRCDRPVTIDLARVAVVGRTADGVEHALAPYDPRAQIKPYRLDGRMAGGEALAYPAATRLAQVCVDAASIANTAPAQWVCFGDREHVAVGR